LFVYEDIEKIPLHLSSGFSFLSTRNSRATSKKFLGKVYNVEFSYFDLRNFLLVPVELRMERQLSYLGEGKEVFFFRIPAPYKKKIILHSDELEGNEFE
jgi:hypothetical protein